MGYCEATSPIAIGAETIDAARTTYEVSPGIAGATVFQVRDGYAGPIPG